MIDLDRALAREGAAWRETLTAPPDLADAAARVAPRRQRRHRPGIRVAASVAAIAALALVGLALALRGGGRPGDVPAAVRLGGHSIPYAGTLSFRDPVLDPNDPRVVRVFIDKDDLGAGQGVCYSELERGVVTSESSDQVRVLVAGYARPAGPECGGVGHGLSPVTVRLPQPLGNRILVDAADGDVHTVLGPATVPRAHRLLAGCPGDSWVTWNERTGRETRTYESNRCDLTIDVGRPGSVGGLDASVNATRSIVHVSGHRATMVREKNGASFYSGIEWRVARDEVIRLVANQSASARAGRSEILAIANSVR